MPQILSLDRYSFVLRIGGCQKHVFFTYELQQPIHFLLLPILIYLNVLDKTSDLGSS